MKALWGSFLSVQVLLAQLLFGLVFINFAHSDCHSLKFITVEPHNLTKKIKCHSTWNAQKCVEKKGFAKFRKKISADGKRILEVKRSRPGFLDIGPMLSLQHSSVLYWIREMRIRARRVTGYKDVCEPILVYIGHKPIFNLGPVFVDSHYFELEGKLYGGMIVLDDAVIENTPVSMISKQDLIKGGYFNLAVAHENAHALMQDIYGVEEFSAVYRKILSRDGHYASQPTDPYLAWVEGFAEGYEAYLGELMDDPSLDEGKAMDRLIESTMKRVDKVDRYGNKALIWEFPGIMMDTAQNIMGLGLLMSDILKLERQGAIRENHFLLQGNFVNLAHRYDLPIFDIHEILEVDSWEVEPHSVVFSKEGIVAHLIYKILAEDLEEPMYRALAKYKPEHVGQFVVTFRQELTPDEWDRIRPTVNALFTEKGRELTRDFLYEASIYRRLHPAKRDEFNQVLQESLEEIDEPLQLDLPKGLWLEFLIADYVPSRMSRFQLGMRRKSVGMMDRVNLGWTRKGRLQSLVRAALSGTGYEAENCQEESLVEYVHRARQGEGAYDINVFSDYLDKKSLEKQEEGSSILAKQLHLIASFAKLSKTCFERKCYSK
jgi:hypothetical protein